MSNSLTTNEPFEFSPTGLTIIGQPTFEQWQEADDYLRYIEGSIQWWVGDLHNYGEAAFAEKYSQVLDKKDYASGTLRNVKSIAGKIDPSRRNDNLHYSHHVEVASLDPELQSELLQLAEQENLTVRQLRQKVRAIKMQNDNDNSAEYDKMVGTVINIIDVLAENYPAGITAIKMYLENSI